MLFTNLCVSQGAESNTAALNLSPTEGTNFAQLVQTCLQIQEQLRATQLSLEQNRQETKAAAAQNAEALSKGLQVLQEAFSAERARELEMMQRSNKLILIAAGTFAALGLLAILIIAYLQWRTSKGLAQVSAGLPAAMGLGAGPAVAALGPTEQSNLRLLGAMELLDKRIHEFKRTVLPGGNGDLARGLNRTSAASGLESDGGNAQARIPLLLNQGQSLMNADNPVAALACFDEVLSFDPNHTEALVKKGAALERLDKLNEAIECYDRAIAVDGSLTLAYLHKGGLYNRLERFKEALECYGKALLTHDQQSS